MNMQRRDLTARLVALLPDSEKISVDEAMLAWWKNFRGTGGYRLTPDGYAIMAGVLEFENWKIESSRAHRCLLSKCARAGYLDINQ